MKKTYVKPSLEMFGSVQDITQTGGTTPGGDAKRGSVDSKGE